MVIVFGLFGLNNICFSATPKMVFSGTMEGTLARWVDSELPDPFQGYLQAEQSLFFNSSWLAKAQIKVISSSFYGAQAALQDRQVRERSFVDYYPGDIYVQYKQGSQLLRLGYQQIVWGEAFGLFFSDFITPKNLYLSPFTDGEQLRRSIGALNYKVLMGENTSAQFIYIPVGQFSKMPPIGSLIGEKKLTEAGVQTISSSSDPHFHTDRGDFGLKLSHSFSGADVSLYGFSYQDRVPVYALDVVHTTLTDLYLLERHSRLSTFGLTAAFEISGYILRLETLRHLQKTFNVMSGLSLDFYKSDEQVNVVALDLPSLGKWNFTLQFSDRRVEEARPGLVVSRYQPSWSFRLSRLLSGEQRLDFLSSYSGDDKGFISNLEYIWPRSSSYDMRIGAEVDAGPDTSHFGAKKNLSYLYVKIHSYFR